MAADLHSAHKILTFLLKSDTSDAINRGSKNRDSFKKVNEVLLKTGSQNRFNLTSTEPMDKVPKQHDRDSVRRTLIEHEKIFRQQVHELHRLYQVQKLLMAELDDKKLNFHSITDEIHRMVQDPTIRLKNSTSTSVISNSSLLSNTHYSTPQPVTQEMFLQESNTAPCLSLFGEETPTAQTSFDLERPAEGHTSVEGYDDQYNYAESDLDLTLSIGPRPCRTKSRHRLFSDSKQRSSSRPSR